MEQRRGRNISRDFLKLARKAALTTRFGRSAGGARTETFVRVTHMARDSTDTDEALVALR